MQTPPKPPKRPISVSLIALLQGTLAAYLVYSVAFAYLDPPTNLGSLRAALCLLLKGQTRYRSYAESSHGEIAPDLFLFSAGALILAADGAVTGWGLWRLKKWARHLVASQYGGMLILWARGFLYFGAFGGFTRVPAATLQPTYIVVAIEAIVCTTLLWHGGVAEAFGEVD